MGLLDYIVIFLYILGIVGAGMVFTSKIKDAKDMFAAGGQSPWWLSGLSSFMTMFSAGTFVIWGGIAYRYGFVAVAINMCYGLAALLVGWKLAGYWRKLGVNSAPEFLQMRFGGSIVQFYTWFQGTIGIFAVGGAIYALAKIVCALVPLPVDHLLADPATGLLSVSFTSVALCVMVIIIAFFGGLWAVLVTDVLQFVILLISVLFVVPLILREAGGWSAFINAVPEGFTSPVNHDFTWWFLTGWIIIHFFKLGGEWSFVQRYTCVPTARDARKSAFLFGVMYLISPIFWMLPALAFRVIDPSADYEQAYILACQLVLPTGMIGLMVAAMASATASAATSQLNVFAGAFTTEVYQRLINPKANAAEMVLAGRIATAILGAIVIAGALLIPRYGYTSFIIDLTTLMTGPLVLPTIWGLYSKKIDIRAAWITTFAGFAAAVILKFGLTNDGFLTGIDSLRPLSEWVTLHMRNVDLLAGILFPLLVLLVIELFSRKESPRYQLIEQSKKAFHEAEALTYSTLPAKLILITIVAIAVVMLALSVFNPAEQWVLLCFSAALLAVAMVIYLLIRRAAKATT